MTPAELADLFVDPAAAGRRAQAARAAQFGRRAFVRAAPAHPAPAVALVLRGAEVLVVPAETPRAPEGQDPWAMAEGSGDEARPDAQGLPGMAMGAGPLGQGARDMVQTSGLGDARGARSGRAAAGTAGAEGFDRCGDPGWPEPGELRAGDRVVVQVERARAGAYFDYLVRLATAAPAGISLAPFCARAGGLFRLHLICAARLALPAGARVEARHDLLGIRLAQVALGFGADTLAGPLAPARHLPLAGVTRPDEATPAGLATLVEQAGLEPVFVDMTPESAP